MRQHVGVFAGNFSSNLLWQNCFAPKKCAFCAEPRRAAAGILDVCQGGATTGLRETRLLRRMFSYARRPVGAVLSLHDSCPAVGADDPVRPNGAKRCHSEPVTDVTGVGIRNLLAENLRKSAGIVHFGNGLPRQSADWLAMTCFFDSLTKKDRHSRSFFAFTFRSAPAQPPRCAPPPGRQSPGAGR